MKNFPIERSSLPAAQSNSNNGTGNPNRFRAVRGANEQNIVTNGDAASLDTDYQRRLRTTAQAMQNLAIQALQQPRRQVSTIAPIAPIHVQRARMQVLPIEGGASSAPILHSSDSSNISASISNPLSSLPGASQIAEGNFDLWQHYATWDDLLSDMQQLEARFISRHNRSEIPNASIAPWNRPLGTYLLDLKYAIADFIQLAKFRTEKNDNSALLRECLYQAIRVSNNIHPMLFELAYKLEFYHHPFRPEEAKGIIPFLTEECIAFSDEQKTELYSTEYRQMVNHLLFYLNSICRMTTTEKRRSFLRRSQAPTISWDIKNPKTNLYLSPFYLNDKIIPIIRKYISMNNTLARGYLKITETSQMEDKAKNLIEKILTKNINLVTDVVLLFSPQNMVNHYANYLNKKLDEYYELTADIPENLKYKKDEQVRWKIQKRIKVMLAKLINEGLDVRHFENCLKSPFHSAKDELANDEFDLRENHPEISKNFTKFQRFFIEVLLNDLNKMRLSSPTLPDPPLPPQQKVAPDKPGETKPESSKLTNTEFNSYGAFLCEKSLDKGFSYIINYFASKDLKFLLNADTEVIWKEIKAGLIRQERPHAHHP